MKNITYRPKEKRYIGRKQIHQFKIIVYAKTQKACVEKLNNEIKRIKDNIKNNKQQINSYTVLEFWNKWYKENKEPFIADTTKDDFKILKNKLTPIHNIPLSKLTKEKILEFINSLKQNRTKEKVILQLKSMLKIAVAEHKIKYNPFDTIIVKETKRQPKPPFNYEEQKTILENLKDKEYKSIILVYLTTGLRLKELDFQNIENNIDENNILKAINLKGREREIRYKYIKLSNEIKNIIISNKEIFHKYTHGMIQDKFHDFLKALKIKGSIVTCRHTFATNCFYLEKDPLIISREMGHSTSEITKENYIKIDYNLNKEKILKLYNNLYNLN